MATLVQSIAMRSLKFLASLIDENNPPFKVALVDIKDGLVANGYLTMDKGEPCFLHGVTMEEAQIHDKSIQALDLLPYIKGQQTASIVLTADTQYFLFGPRQWTMEHVQENVRVIEYFKYLANVVKSRPCVKVLFTTLHEPDVAHEALLEYKRGRLYIAPDDFGNTLSLPLEEGNVNLIEMDPGDKTLCTLNLTVYPEDDEHEGAVLGV